MDIFDRITETPKGDIFDRIAPPVPQTPPLMQRVGGKLKELMSVMVPGPEDWEAISPPPPVQPLDVAVSHAPTVGKTKPVPKAIPNEQVDRSQWPLRQDGTQKGFGWLGVLPNSRGGVSSELTAGITMDGKDYLIPTMVPTLDSEEINYLLDTKESPEMFKTPIGKRVLDKAVAHAKKRIREGKSPFADESPLITPQEIAVSHRQSSPVFSKEGFELTQQHDALQPEIEELNKIKTQLDKQPSKELVDDYNSRVAKLRPKIEDLKKRAEQYNQKITVENVLANLPDVVASHQPPPPNPLAMIPRGAAAGTLDIAESIGTGLKYLGGRTGIDALKETGETVESYWGEKGKKFEPPPAIQGSIVDKPELLADPAWLAYSVSNVAPSFAAAMLPAMGTTRAIQILGKAFKFTPQLISKLAALGGAVTGGTAGGALEGANTYQELLKKGASEKEAARAAEIMAAASAFLNAISVGKALSPGKLAAVKHVLQSAGVESITEYLEEPSEALIKHFAGYTTPEEFKEQIVSGLNVIPPTAITGGVGGGGGVVTRSKEAVKTPTPQVPPIAPAPEPVKALPEEELFLAKKGRKPKAAEAAPQGDIFDKIAPEEAKPEGGFRELPPEAKIEPVKAEPEKAAAPKKQTFRQFAESKGHKWDDIKGEVADRLQAEYQKSEAAGAPTKAEEIKPIFKGASEAISENLYSQLFDALSKGKDTIAGVKDPVLAWAKPLYDRGLIKSAEDLKRLIHESYGKKKPTEAPVSPVSGVGKGEVLPSEGIDVKSSTDQGFLDRSGGFPEPIPNIGKTTAIADKTDRNIQIPTQFSLPAGEPSERINVKVSIPESTKNSLPTDPKAFSDIVDSKTFREHGLGGFDTPSQRSMISGMLPMLQNPQVRDIIIKSIPIDVVDNLSRLKSPSDVILHDDPMLKTRFSVNTDGSVSLSINGASSLMRSIARAATELSSSKGKIRVETPKLNPASEALNSNAPNHKNIITQPSQEVKGKSPQAERKAAPPAETVTGPQEFDTFKNELEKNNTATIAGTKFEIKQRKDGGYFATKTNPNGSMIDWGLGITPPWSKERVITRALEDAKLALKPSSIVEKLVPAKVKPPEEAPKPKGLEARKRGKQAIPALIETKPLSYDELQKQIDAKIDELMKQGKSFEEASSAPEVEKLYEARDAIGKKELTQNANELKARINDLLADSVLKDIYKIDPESKTGQAMASLYTTKQVKNREDSLNAIARKILLEEDFRGVTNGAKLSNISPLTDKGKQELHDEIAKRAKRIEAAVHDYFYPGESSVSLPEPVVEVKEEAKSIKEAPKPTLNLKDMLKEGTYPGAPENVSKITVFPIESVQYPGKFSLYNKTENTFYGSLKNTFEEAVAVANKENLRMYEVKPKAPTIKEPFQVDEKVVMHSPYTGEDTIVNYRGPMLDGKAAVWTGRTQITVPEEWLSKQREPKPEPSSTAKEPYEMTWDEYRNPKVGGTLSKFQGSIRWAAENGKPVSFANLQFLDNKTLKRLGAKGKDSKELANDLSRKLARLPGIKEAQDFPSKGIQATPTLKGSPLMQAVEKAKEEKVQPGLGLKAKTLSEKEPEVAFMVKELRDMVNHGEPGKRIGRESGETIAWGSSYPTFMKNKGWTRAEVLGAIDKGLKGEKLGLRQKQIFDAAVDEGRAINAEQLEREAKDRELASVVRKDPELLRDETISELTNSYEDEIMGIREELNNDPEGYTQSEITEIIGEVERAYKEESGPSDIEAIKRRVREKFAVAEPESEPTVRPLETTKTKKEVMPPSTSESGFIRMDVLPPVWLYGKVMDAIPVELREKVYQSIVNRYAAIENLDKKAKGLGARIRPGESPGMAARTYLGIEPKIQETLTRNTFRINEAGNIENTGEGLEPILKDYNRLSPAKDEKIKVQEFNDYFISTRIIEDLQRPKGHWTTEEIVTPEQIQEAREKLDRLKLKYGNLDHFEEIAPRFYEFKQRVLHLLVDSGNMSEDQYEDIVERNPHHVSFSRVLDKVDPVTPGSPRAKKPFTEARSPVKKIKGSEKEIHEVIGSTIKDVYRIMDVAARNKVAVNVAKLQDLPDLGIEEVKPPNIPTYVSAREIKTITRHFRTRAEKVKESVSHGGLAASAPMQKLDEIVSEALQRRGFTAGEASAFINRIRATGAKEGAAPTGETTTKTIERIIQETVLAIETPMDSTIWRPSPFKPKGNVIEYFDDGERKYLSVPDNLYDAMTGLTEVSSDMLTRIMSIPARMLRTGVTSTPEFIARNLDRDQFDALIQADMKLWKPWDRKGYRGPVDTIMALVDIIKGNEAFHSWLKSGAAHSTFVDLSRKTLEKKAMELLRHPSKWRYLNIIQGAQQVSQALEMATRGGLYKGAKRTGLSDIEAAMRFREGTVDFGVRGANPALRRWSQVTAFFNPAIQGTARFVRAHREHPLRTAAMSAALITIPSIFMWMVNHDDDDYKEVPQWQKDLFWLIKVGKKDSPITWVRIPKPFLFGQIYGSAVERLLDYLNTKDPKAIKGFFKSLVDASTPIQGDPNGVLLPTGAKPLIENATNYQFFSQRPTVPESRENLPPFMQYGKYTTETAKELGKAIGYSPAKLENLIRGVTGGAGQYALEASDLAMGALGRKVEGKRPREWADVPLVKGFVTRPVESAPQSLTDFYENTKELEAAYRGYMDSLKNVKSEDAKYIRDKWPKLFISPSMVSMRENISLINKQIDMLTRSNMPELSKRNAIRKAELFRMELAQKANKMMKPTSGSPKSRGLGR